MDICKASGEPSIKIPKLSGESVFNKFENITLESNKRSSSNGYATASERAEKGLGNTSWLMGAHAGESLQ